MLQRFRRRGLPKALAVAGYVTWAAGGLLPGCGHEPRPTAPIYVRLPVNVLTPQFIQRTGFNRDHIRDNNFAFGYLDRTALANLPADTASTIIELDAQAWATQLFDTKTLRPVADDTIDRAPIAGQFAEAYHDYDDLTAELQRLAAEYPTLMTLSSAGQSVERRELWVATISDTDQTSTASAAEPQLLYVANMHGDEVVGRELMLYLLRYLLAQYNHEPRIKNLLDNTQIFIMPSMNPDGFELGQRGNADGIDLNRDFPDFTSDPHDSPQGRAVETRALMKLHQEHHFVAALNFHGGDVCFNMPWDTHSNSGVQDRFGDDLLMQKLGRRYADANVTMRANSGGSFNRGLTYGYEWYEIDGGMQDWANRYRDSFHATVELSRLKWPNSANLPRYWDENRDALINFLEDSTFGMHLQLVDESGQGVEGATITVSSLPRGVTFPGPYVSRLALPGDQTVTVSAPGYATTSLRTAPSLLVGRYQTVVLRH